MAARLPRLRPGAYKVARPPTWLAHRAGHPWEQLALPALAAGRKMRLIYSPANVAPLLWPRNVVLVHDVSPLRHPEWYSRTYSAWQRALLSALVRRGAYFVTVSAFSRDEICELLGVPVERVSVIAGGVDTAFSPTADPEPARRAYALNRPYVLTVATASARKNLAALELAARHLREHDVELIVAGGTRAYLPGAALPGHARVLGYVPEDLLPGLYAGARAFVLPSRYEGFGLTCLEAMASGLPVVASDEGALKETCSGAALLADPADEHALAAAVVGSIGEGAARERLREAGIARAAQYGWGRAARATDELLARLASGGPAHS
jgi:glycosyltransferase involved in cell wall biosynthesis